jgi:signal transduction histidine kinase
MSLRLRADLQAHPFFQDLEPSVLDWLETKLEVREYAANEVAFQKGDPSVFMVIIFEGAFEGRDASDGSDARIYYTGAQDVTGKLPYSRMHTLGVTVRCEGPTRVGLLHESNFPELLYRAPKLGERLVARMTDRVREVTRTDEQRDRLESLGRLSAGIAHELNNPAAAAKRASDTLLESLQQLEQTNLELLKQGLTPETYGIVLEIERDILGKTAPNLSTLEFSEREDELINWLEGQNVPDAFDLAPKLLESGMTLPALQSLESSVPASLVPAVISRIATSLETNRLISSLEHSVAQISELVTAIKSYSYMDSGGTQAVDINAGLKNTLVVLEYKARVKKIQIVKTLEPNLPMVQARGGQLNQVWTNLIDNAIDALPEGGSLSVSSFSEGERVRVEIEDNGPGIPAEIQAQIFEPFFTTKAVGQGTGLGLDTARRIVRQHKGELRLESKPGLTRFTVRLPLA